MAFCAPWSVPGAWAPVSLGPAWCRLLQSAVVPPGNGVVDVAGKSVRQACTWPHACPKQGPCRPTRPSGEVTETGLGDTDDHAFCGQVWRGPGWGAVTGVMHFRVAVGRSGAKGTQWGQLGRPEQVMRPLWAPVPVQLNAPVPTCPARPEPGSSWDPSFQNVFNASPKIRQETRDSSY